MSDPIMEPVDSSEELSPEELGFTPDMGYPPSDEDLGADVRTYEEDDDNDGDEEPENGEKRKRGRKRKPSKKTIQRQNNSRDMSFNQWCEWIDQRVGWEAPGTITRLTRLEPTYYKGNSAAGLLDEKASGKFSEAEVMERFGGGLYQVDVQGSRREPGKEHLPPLNFKKRFRVAGAPRLTDDMPENMGTRSPTAAKAEAEAEKTAVSHLGQLTKQLFMATQTGGKGDEKYFSSTMQAHEDRVRAREQMAEERVQEAARAQKRAEEELERVRSQVRREQGEMEERMRATQTESNNLMAALLPAFSQNANQQVQQTMATFQAREQRIESDHAKEIQALQRNHEMSLERADQQRSAEPTRQDAMYQSQIGILQAQLSTIQLQLEAERNANNQLRGDIQKLHLEQLQSYAADRDPLTQIQKMQAFNEMAKEVIGAGGESADPGGLSPDAPDYMKLLARGIETIGPAIQAVVEARKGGAPAGQPQQQQYTPEQIQQIQHQRMLMAQQQAQQQQFQAPQPRPEGAPPQAPTKAVRIKAKELQKALELLDAVRPSGTTPQEAAQAAMHHGDQAMLKALSSRPADAVIDQIDQRGILPAGLAEPEGRQFLTEVLNNLRQMTAAPGTATNE